MGLENHTGDRRHKAKEIVQAEGSQEDRPNRTPSAAEEKRGTPDWFTGGSEKLTGRMQGTRSPCEK